MDKLVLTPEKVAAYNRELLAFFAKSEETVRKLFELKSRTIFFALAVSNAGSAPANDLSIHAHFPDGFVLREKDAWEKLWNHLPRPPQKPTSPLDHLASMGSLYTSHIPNMSSDIAAAIRSRAQSEPSLSITKTNSYDVEFVHPKLKHGQEALLGEFALTFDNAPFSFQVEYSAVADNVPEIVEGTLNFIAPPEHLA